MINNFYFKYKFTNVYKKPSKQSEVTSQILYGEKFKILSRSKNWIKIKTSFDDYIGYIENKKYVKKHNATHKVFTLKACIYNNQISKNNFLPFGSKISIVTENNDNVQKFLNEVDSSSVMHNLPTCWADGFEYGLGAEVGISTDKIHARGPVGLEGLTSQKFIVKGDANLR